MVLLYSDISIKVCPRSDPSTGEAMVKAKSKTKSKAAALSELKAQGATTKRTPTTHVLGLRPSDRQATCSASES